MIADAIEQEMQIRTSHRIEQQALILKALGHPSRLLMVQALADGPLCVCDLTELVGSEMSTVSRHLAQLKQAGLLQVVDEERQLPERGDRLIRRPLDVHLASERIDCRRPLRASRRFNRRAISRWVTARNHPRIAHPSRIRRLSADRQRRQLPDLG